MLRSSKSFVHIAFCGLVLGLPGVVLAQNGQQADLRSVAASQPATASPSPVQNVAPAELPDSPGAVLLMAQAATPQQDAGSPPATSPSAPSGSPPTAAPAGQAQEPQRPVGTAAAEAPTVNGVTAAEPTGVAIAPAKQRRARTLVIKVGVIVGAAVALGAVIALTEATPSKPPGAH
jgi:cytoskeletal protein RodZ